MQAPQSETNAEKSTQKILLREALLRARNALPPAAREAATAAIASGVIGWWETHRPASLGVYWPMRGEPDLRPLYQVLQAHGVQLALPVVDGDNHPLRFLSWMP